MTFNNITAGAACNCLSGSLENTTDKFIRRIDKKSLREQDMRSHHDRGKEPGEDCKEICGYKGISVDIYSGESLEAAKNMIFETRKFSPGFKKNLAVVIFSEGAGVVKYTPDQSPRNPFHYDFFKSDGYVHEMVVVDQIVTL